MDEETGELVEDRNDILENVNMKKKVREKLENSRTFRPGYEDGGLAKYDDRAQQGPSLIIGRGGHVRNVENLRTSKGYW